MAAAKASKPTTCQEAKLKQRTHCKSGHMAPSFKSFSSQSVLEQDKDVMSHGVVTFTPLITIGSSISEEQ
eukprot:4490862-Amphidinium_carterae.2